MFANNQSLQPSTTNNNSIVFSSSEDVNKLCTKADIDTFLARYNGIMVFEEFSLGQMEKFSFEKNEEKYKSLSSYPRNCQYQVSYLEMASNYNFVEITEIELVKDETLDLQHLSEDKVFADFINNADDTVVSLVVKKYLKEFDKEDYSKYTLVAEEAASYTLIAKPIYIVYHFADLKLVNDYEIAGINGLHFELIKTQ